MFFNRITYKYILINIFIFFIIYQNKLPYDFFFGSGDFEQVINIDFFFQNYGSAFTDDFPGAFNHLTPHLIYYFPVLLLSKFININVNTITNYFNFIFIFFSFWSCYFSLSIIFKDFKIEIKAIISFLYIFNYVFYLSYWYTWVYTPYFLFYIMFPLNFAIFYQLVLHEKFISKKWFNKILYYSPLIFFNNIGFANLAFLIVLFNCYLVIFLTYFLFTIFSYKRIDLSLVTKFIVFLFIFSIINIWSILPPLSNYLIVLNEVANNEYSFSSIGWIFSQAANINNLFELGGYEGFKNLKFINFYFFFFPIFIFFILFKIKVDLFKRSILIYLLMNLFILNKGISILPENFIENLFIDSFLYAFRSSDKSLITLPFIIILIFSFYINNHKFNNQLIISISVLLISILSFYPILLGGLKVTNDLLFDKGDNYLTSKRAMIHKVPDTYYDLSKFINENSLRGNILALPYSESPSMGWVYIDKMGYIGTDFTRQIISKDLFRLENIFMNGANIGSLWNNSNKDDDYILNMIELFPLNYILYHKDFSKGVNEKTKKLIQKLEIESNFKILFSNEDFNLYEFKKEKNIFSFPKHIVKYNYNASILKDILNSNKININEKQFILGRKQFYENHPIESIANEVYKKLNKIEDSIFIHNSDIKYSISDLQSPTKYKLSIENLVEDRIFITFHKSFHKNWTLKCLNFDCEKKHSETLGYANGWDVNILEKSVNKLEFEVYYVTQKYLTFSKYISLLFLIIPSVFFISKRKNV